jgi:hypothetical protein
MGSRVSFLPRPVVHRKAELFSIIADPVGAMGVRHPRAVEDTAKWSDAPYGADSALDVGPSRRSACGCTRPPRYSTTCARAASERLIVTRPVLGACRDGSRKSVVEAPRTRLDRRAVPTESGPSRTPDAAMGDYSLCKHRRRSVPEARHPGHAASHNSGKTPNGTRYAMNATTT